MSPEKENSAFEYSDAEMPVQCEPGLRLPYSARRKMRLRILSAKLSTSIVRRNTRSLDSAELPKDGNSAPLGMTKYKFDKDSLDNIFQDQRHAHSAAHTQGGDSTFSVALQHLVQQRYCDARAGASDRMSESDGAAVHIEAVTIEV